ncbi:MAG: hypothetical protein ACKO96_33000 [Flammeovirgaceae bacterium]
METASLSAQRYKIQFSNLYLQLVKIISYTIHRLNQGWHIAKILKTVPNKVPFSNGQEMLGDIIGSVTPRIFFTNKKAIHTNEKFRKYTGHKLGLSTVMTIGIIGDFYVNFGRNGSFILLFVFGGLISIFLKFFIKRHVLNDPINLVWLPFLFSYLVRADNDFYAFSNGFIKGYLIFIVVNYIRKIVRHRYSVIG